MPTGISRKLLGATFVPTDTIWHHFQHFCRLFTAYAPAQQLLDHELARQNHTVCCTAEQSPDAAGALALAEGRTTGSPCPAASLLDL